jgi:O-antigen ligase
VQAGLFTKLFGIGAGSSYRTKSGEARTYIHNYPVYLLVFDGLFGLAAFLIMMVWVCWRLLVRWWVNGDDLALATLGVAAALFSNSLLFATHKLVQSGPGRVV